MASDMSAFRSELQEAAKALQEFRRASADAAKDKDDELGQSVTQAAGSNRGREDFSSKIVAAIEKQSGDDIQKQVIAKGVAEVVAIIKVVAAYLPGLSDKIAEIKTVIVANKAQDTVKDLAAEAAAAGVGLSDEQIQQEFSAQKAAEIRSEQARMHVEAITGGGSMLLRMAALGRANQAGR